MELEIIDYPADGKLADLSRTCGGDEDGFRGPLVSLERVKDSQGKKATRATYAPIPVTQKYIKKALFFFDVTNATPNEKKDITEKQLQKGHTQAFKNGPEAEVFLENNPATVAVYRE